jgi:hypothetical protein
MRLFLMRHGRHEAWSRVSAPLLRDRIGSPRERGVIETRFPFEQFVPDRIHPVATWKSDPRLSELEALRFVNRESLVESSYAGLVHEELISKCEEESFPAASVVEMPWHDELADGAPRYRYDSLAGALRLVIPMSFVVETAKRAVRSFETEAIERDIVPFKMGAGKRGA